MQTHVFQVVIEPDEDRWRAYCPELEEYGGATWGYTRKEAEKNIREVLAMVLETMVEHNYSIPGTPARDGPAPDGILKEVRG